MFEGMNWRMNRAVVVPVFRASCMKTRTKLECGPIILSAKILLKRRNKLTGKNMSAKYIALNSNSWKNQRFNNLILMNIPEFHLINSMNS